MERNACFRLDFTSFHLSRISEPITIYLILKCGRCKILWAIDYYHLQMGIMIANHSTLNDVYCRYFSLFSISQSFSFPIVLDVNYISESFTGRMYGIKRHIAVFFQSCFRPLFIMIWWLYAVSFFMLLELACEKSSRWANLNSNPVSFYLH